MPRAFSAVSRRIKNCPLGFQRGDRMTFSLPGLVAEECDRICALAITDLVPVVERFERLAEQGVESRGSGQGIFCTGCKEIGAFVEFNVEEAIIEGAEGLSPEESKAIVESLKQYPLFKPLPDLSLLRLHRILRKRELEEDTIIIESGDRGRALYLIEEGDVEVVTTDANDVETVIATLSSGDCFGEMSLLTGEPVSATIRTETPVVLQMIRKRDFDRLLVDNPSLNQYFTRLLADRLKKTSQHFIEEIEKGVLGYLNMIQPPELIQALTVTERSGTLHARNDEQEISICLRSGQAHRIETEGWDDPDPEEAFYTFLSWREGTFRFEPTKNEEDEAVERTFHKDITALLLEGMRRMDEASMGEDAIDFLDE